MIASRQPVLRACGLVAAAFFLAAASGSDELAPTLERPTQGQLCDRLAGNPDDADLTGTPGVAFDDIDPAAAEPACRDAVAQQPDERRYLFELARVLRKKEDFAGSLAYYQKAADKGSLIAMIGIGLLYEDGDGVDQDYVKAADYYRKAADAGSVVAMGYLADLYDRGYLAVGDSGAAEAARLYERQVERGDEFALVNLGQLYEAGRGVAKDIGRAEALYRQAIAGKDPDAVAYGQNLLAFMWAVQGENLSEAEDLANAAVAAAADADDFDPCELSRHPRLGQASARPRRRGAARCRNGGAARPRICRLPRSFGRHLYRARYEGRGEDGVAEGAVARAADPIQRARLGPGGDPGEDRRGVLIFVPATHVARPWTSTDPNTI